MKFSFTIFVVCLVGIQAGPVDYAATDYEGQFDAVLEEMAAIAKDAGAALKKQIEQSLLDPLQQIEALVNSIDELRAENEQCVADEDTKVASTVDVVHKEFSACGTAAANTSAKIVTDVAAATQQVIFGGYDVWRLRKKCNSYSKKWLRDACFMQLSVKSALYLKNARKSINSIKKDINESLPATAAEANSCTNDATEKAVLELENIRAAIEDCIGEASVF